MSSDYCLYLVPDHAWSVKGYRWSLVLQQPLSYLLQNEYTEIYISESIYSDIQVLMELVPVPRHFAVQLYTRRQALLSKQG